MDNFKSTPIIDYTDVINNIPNPFGLLNQLYLFNVVYHKGRDFEVNGDSYTVPHFPMDDAIFTKDLEQNDGKTFEDVLNRKLEILSSSHSILQEASGATCLFEYEAFAPNKTVGYIYKHNVSPQVITVDDASLQKVEQDFKDKGVEGDIICICSPEAFMVIKNSGLDMVECFPPIVQGFSARYRSLKYSNTYFVEYRGRSTTKPFVPSGKAFMLPLKEKVATMHFAPQQSFTYVNTEAKKIYATALKMEGEDFTEIMSESNVLCVLDKPDLVVELVFK